MQKTMKAFLTLFSLPLYQVLPCHYYLLMKAFLTLFFLPLFISILLSIIYLSLNKDVSCLVYHVFDLSKILFCLLLIQPGKNNNSMFPGHTRA